VHEHNSDVEGWLAGWHRRHDTLAPSQSPVSVPAQLLQQEAFEKCLAHSPLRAVLHCHHSPDVATVARNTVARRLRIDVYNDDDYDNA